MSLPEVSLLLVDDDPSAIQVMGRMLAQYPNQRFATSGEVALRLAREATPDLILLDVDMPDMTGFDVCEALKLDPALADVPVIFVTSHEATALLRVAAWQKGAAVFLTKPLVAAQLTARVRAQLRARQLIEDVKRDSRASSAAPRQPSVRAARILIVDDDTASIHILSRTLAEMGDLHFAKTGEEALQIARSLLPDLILLDAHMPGLDGFDVCRSLKAEPAFRHVPIAFVTRFSDPQYEMRALDLGAADFIAKPYTAAVLQARVRNLLALKRRTEAELQGAREQREAQPRSRIEADTPSIDVRAVDAARCADEAAAAVSALAQQAGVALSSLPASSSILVAAEPERLHQCLVNLLTNAIKYNRRSGGWVRIEVSDDSQHKVAIAVRDNGIGMDALQRQHLFEPFNRLGRPSDAAPGTGLGLVITRQLVEAMNGQLRVDSEPGMGSCFTIVLPGLLDTP